MADKNRGVVYQGPGKVHVEDIPFPKLELDYKGHHRDCQHGVLLQVVSINICGPDQHMVSVAQISTWSEDAPRPPWS